MARIEVRGRLQPAHRRGRVYASSRVPAERSGGISLKQLTQMPGLKRHASGATAPRWIRIGGARREYRRARCPPRLLPGAGSKHKPEPNALLAECDARRRTTQTQSPNRKV